MLIFVSGKKNDHYFVEGCSVMRRLMNDIPLLSALKESHLSAIVCLITGDSTVHQLVRQTNYQSSALWALYEGKPLAEPKPLNKRFSWRWIKCKSVDTLPTTYMHFIHPPKIVTIGWGHHDNFCVWKKTSITFVEVVKTVSGLKYNSFQSFYAIAILLRLGDLCDNHTGAPCSKPRATYSISQEICTRFCCALLCCGYAIVHNEFTWSIYPYSSGLLCWHWGNR